MYLRIEGEQFDGVPINLELRLSVKDSPNSAGIVVDAICRLKLALDNKLSGNIVALSAYFMKHPKIQMDDFFGRKRLEGFINEYANINWNRFEFKFRYGSHREKRLRASRYIG